MLQRNIDTHIELFKQPPVIGEKMTLGRREFQVRRVGKVNYQLVETFFLQGSVMSIDSAKKLAKTLLECFGSPEEAHAGYKRAMQNNCSFHEFGKLLDLSERKDD